MAINKINLEALLLRNPSADPAKVREAIEMYESVGFKSEYRLAIPYASPVSLSDPPPGEDPRSARLENRQRK
jgi:hypothetical protein